jgi:hypothetical protein
MGPSEPNETIKEYPTSRYLVGRLAPARASEDDKDAEIDVLENDTLAVAGDDEEDGGEDSQAPLIIGFNPSSFGLSFLLDAQIDALCVEISWGDYKREKDEENKIGWQRYPRHGIVDDLPVDSAGPIPLIVYRRKPEPKGVVVSGVDDPK